MPCGCGSLPSGNEGLALVFLERAAVRPAPSLRSVVSRCARPREEPWGRYLSVDDEDAIKLAISEYLHVDCRLMHAKQCGRVRSHCPSSQSGASTTPGQRTHFGFALDAFFTAQRWFVALLLLPWWRIAVRRGRGIGTCRGLRALVIHCAARAADGGRRTVDDGMRGGGLVRVLG